MFKSVTVTCVMEQLENRWLHECLKISPHGKALVFSVVQATLLKNQCMQLWLLKSMKIPYILVE